MKYFVFIGLIALLACSSKKERQIDLPIDLQIIKLSSPTNASLRGISVLDSNTAWLSGAKGNVIRISHGGSKILIMRAPDQDTLDFRDIHSFSEREIIVSSAAFPAKVYRSATAGKDWELVYENLDSSAFLNSIHFKDSVNGIIFGDQLDAYHFILSTRDSGRSWQRIDASFLPPPLPLEHGFAASGSCITVNAENKYIIGLGGEQSRVLIGNPSEVWKAYNTGYSDPSPSSGIYSIVGFKNVIMAVGGNYEKPNEGWPVWFSQDSGKNWKQRGKLNGYRSVIDHYEKLDLWMAAGSNGIDISMNNGLNWEKVSDLNINTLQFDDESGIAYAAGPNGKIYKLIIKAKN